MNDFFKFEDKDWDYPFYKLNPRVSYGGWILLFASLIISLIVYGIFPSTWEITSGIIFCLIMLIPVLYVAKWDYKIIFHKPTLKDVGLALLLGAGYVIYAIAFGTFVESIGLVALPSNNTSPYTVITLISLIFSLMGEELIKFIPFVFFLRVIYKYTNKRKLGIIISSILIMIGFGALHYDPALGIGYALAVQGLGTIFEIIGYLKTKNLIVPYITHLLIDFVLMVIAMSGL